MEKGTPRSNLVWHYFTRSLGALFGLALFFVFLQRSFTATVTVQKIGTLEDSKPDMQTRSPGGWFGGVLIQPTNNSDFSLQIHVRRGNSVFYSGIVESKDFTFLDYKRHNLFAANLSAVGGKNPHLVLGDGAPFVVSTKVLEGTGKGVGIWCGFVDDRLFRVSDGGIRYVTNN